MKIELLKEFLHLSKNLNFSQTAEELFITQSVLSKHIASIEKEIGAPLFLRNRHSVELTKAGEAFYKEAKEIVERYDAGMKHIHELVNTDSLEIRIGYLYEHAKDQMLSCVKEFRESYPSVKLSLFSCRYDELHRLLKSRELDLIFTLDLVRDFLDKCEIVPLYEDKLIIAMSKDHPMAGVENITMDMLQKTSLLLPDERSFDGFAPFVKKSFQDNKDITYFDCMSSVMILVDNSTDIAVIPGKFNPKDVTGRIIFKEISDADLTYKTAAIFREEDDEKTRLIKTFVKMFKSI